MSILISTPCDRGPSGLRLDHFGRWHRATLDFGQLHSRRLTFAASAISRVVCQLTHLTLVVITDKNDVSGDQDTPTFLPSGRTVGRIVTLGTELVVVLDGITTVLTNRTSTTWIRVTTPSSSMTSRIAPTSLP
jgi:hypothetical protein